MNADSDTKRTGIGRFMLELVQNNLPANDERTDREERTSEQWPYALVTIAFLLAFLRVLLFGFPD